MPRSNKYKYVAKLIDLVNTKNLLESAENDLLILLRKNHVDTEDYWYRKKKKSYVIFQKQLDL